MEKLYLVDQRGTGILEILVMSGVILLVTQFMMQSFSDFKIFQKNKKFQMSHFQLRSYLNDSVNCFKTISNLGGSCNIGEPIEIVSNSDINPILINSYSYKKVGRYLVRAQCATCNDCVSGVAIDIEAMLVDNKKQAIVHPIYKTKGWFSVFKNKPFKCVF